MSALHDALDAIDAERSELQMRLEALAEAATAIRWLLIETVPVVPARVPDGAPVVAPRPKPKAAPVEGEVACPECGQVVATVGGLGVHRARKHGVYSTNPRTLSGKEARAKAAAKAATPPAPTPMPINVNGAPPGHFAKPDELALRCDDCPATFTLEQRGRLVAHTVSAHKRDARPVERTPRRAGDLAVAS